MMIHVYSGETKKAENEMKCSIESRLVISPWVSRIQCNSSRGVLWDSCLVCDWPQPGGGRGHRTAIEFIKQVLLFWRGRIALWGYERDCDIAAARKGGGYGGRSRGVDVAWSKRATNKPGA